MLEGREFRELLIADMALLQGIASAGDVAAALQRFWERRERADVSVAGELARIAGIDREALRPAEKVVDAMIANAGGNARIALTRHGGVDRSVHHAFGKGGRILTRALSVLGVPIRAPLAPIRRERYADFELAGRGGMGVVYAAIDTEMNRRVAFKMVRTEDGADDSGRVSSPLEASKPAKDSLRSEAFEQFKARLVQEAWVTGGLEHPGIVPVYEIGQTPTGIPYYTMRYVRGERTLADAIEEKRKAPFEERLSLLEPFLKVCDTLRYAHDKGVVHRDIKPANVALGHYGEVILLDWGLARLEGQEDVASSAWQERVQEMREDAGFHTMEGGALGTAGYMSPEATMGRLAEVDARSDVYSLGAMLHEILTACLPFAFRSYAEYASLLLRESPRSARDVDPSVPQALSSLCARALSRDRAGRPASAQALAEAVRAWQTENALDREVEGLLRDARSALEGATGIVGEARLQQTDRAGAALAQVEAKRPGTVEAQALRDQTQSLRQEGIRQRERATTRRTLRRVAVGGLAAAAVAAFVVTTVIEGKRKEAETARAEAVTARAATQTALDEVRNERDAKGKALGDVLRLADSKRVRDLADEVDRLWPLEPEKAGDMATWMVRAREVLGNRDGHRRRLAAIRASALPYTEEARAKDRTEVLAQIEAGKQVLAAIEEEKATVKHDAPELRFKALGEEAAKASAEVERLQRSLEERRTWVFPDPHLDWQHQVLVDLLAGLDALDAGEGKGKGGLSRVARRHEFATTLRRVSIEDPADGWKQEIDAIAASPRYGGLKIVPQLGLVPLGVDPESGLFEFAHLGSGTIPRRDETSKRLVYENDTAIVLVLVPSGTFQMGAQKEDPSAPNYDPQAESDESPVHDVTISPFFLGKHECTQAQWRRMTEGEDPSAYKDGATVLDQLITPRNPVEQVSWTDCSRWLDRNRLALPTEAQWEYACRAGTHTPWITGTDVSKLGQVANIADAYIRRHEGGASLMVTPEVDDGHAVHAPVGSFRANAFGFHDMHGNVMEWCRDGYRNPYTGEPATDPVVVGSDRRVCRGGSWFVAAMEVRSANRTMGPSEVRDSPLGLRPARPLALK